MCKPMLLLTFFSVSIWCRDYSKQHFIKNTVAAVVLQLNYLVLHKS